jgi:monothiol glutaredoxin
MLQLPSRAAGWENVSIGLAVGQAHAILPPMSNSQPKITAYLKTFCGWSEGVRAIMRKYDLQFEEKDIIKNPAYRWEMEQKSGQPLSPCVEVDGTMLADVSGEEVEAWMIENGKLARSEAEADAPTNSACTDEQHEAMARGELPGAKIKFVD